MVVSEEEEIDIISSDLTENSKEFDTTVSDTENTEENGKLEFESSEFVAQKANMETKDNDAEIEEGQLEFKTEVEENDFVLEESSEDNFAETDEIDEEDINNFAAITEKQYSLFDNVPVTENEVENIEIEVSEASNETEQEDNKNEIKIETENEEDKVLISEEIVEEAKESEESKNDVENHETVEEAETENQNQDENERILFEDILAETEIKDEDIIETVEEEPKEPKTVILDFNKKMGKLETALEIKYSSLKLTKLPLKVSNVPEGMTFPDELVIGNASIKVGDKVVPSCYLKVTSNESVKILEIKHREFKLGLSVTLNNDTMNAYGSVRYYEISSLIKYSRMIKVLEMLDDIFSGKPITFKVNKLNGNIIAEDRIELMRIKTVSNFFETVNKSGQKFKEDISQECDNIYYFLELNAALKENRIIETWCNFNLSNEYISVNEGNSLIIKRTHKVDNHHSIEEKITLIYPLDENNIFKEKTIGYRRPCVIELSKINN